MGEKRRLNLSFSLSSPRQRQAWEILSAIPARQRMEAVCRMVVEYRSQTELIGAVCDAVRDELRRTEIPKVETEDVSNDVLGFLLSLQEGDGEF